MSRRLLYLTGTRADFGLMLPTLRRLAAAPGLELGLCVTGMHLSERFGLTVREVEASGLSIAARIPADPDDDSSLGMSRMGACVSQGMVEVLSKHRPDVLLLLGDRVEILAAAVPAMLASVPIAHLCGGERSGTVDDAMRHAISKLAHLHLVATHDAGQRLIRMGEEAHRIHVVGTPGLVGIESLVTTTREALARRFGLDPALRLATVLFHPVVQDESLAGEQCMALLKAVKAEGFQALCLLPNADVGNGRIRQAIEHFCATTKEFRPITHLGRPDYVSMLASCDVLVGNSSSGIIEAATFGTPVVNVGDRQSNRERNANIVDTGTSTDQIRTGIRESLARPRECGRNIYGDGQTDERVASILSHVTLDTALLKKSNTY